MRMTIRPALTALLTATALAACSEPMEQPAPPPGPDTAQTDEAPKTAEIPMPEIRDAEGISPREEAEAATGPTPFFDPREAGAASSSFDPGSATRPDAIGEATVTARAAGSFTAPGANETAWLVTDEDGAARIVIVSVRGAARDVPLDLTGAEIVAAEDTDMDGLTELLLYTPPRGEETPARASHISLRSGELEELESWDSLLPATCPENAERTGTQLMVDEKTGAITEDTVTAPC